MPQLIFGCVFLVLSLVLCLSFYTGSGEITVLGEVYTAEAFKSLPLPRLILGFFVLLGLFLIALAIKKLVKKGAIKNKGISTYGFVVGMTGPVPMSGRSGFSKALLRRTLNWVDILIIDDAGELKSYREPISYSKMGSHYRYLYNVHDFLNIKYLEGRIAIIGKVAPYDVPAEIREKLEANRGKFGMV